MPPDRWSRDVSVCGVGSEVGFVFRLWLLVLVVVVVVGVVLGVVWV